DPDPYRADDRRVPRSARVDKRGREAAPFPSISSFSASPPGAACATADAAHEQADQPDQGEDDRDHEQPVDREADAERNDCQNRKQYEKKQRCHLLRRCSVRVTVECGFQLRGDYAVTGSGPSVPGTRTPGSCGCTCGSSTR